MFCSDVFCSLCLVNICNDFVCSSFFSLFCVDGRVIKLANERYEAAEVLFQPHLIDVEQPGVHEMLFNMIQVNKQTNTKKKHTTTYKQKLSICRFIIAFSLVFFLSVDFCSFLSLIFFFPCVVLILCV